MKTHFLSLFILLSLCGCALTPDEAATLSDYELCSKMLLTNNSKTREVAFTRLEQKGLLENCRAKADLIKASNAASQAQSDALMLNGLAILGSQQQSRAQPQVFCNTTQQGYFINTHCWKQ